MNIRWPADLSVSQDYQQHYRALPQFVTVNFDDTINCHGRVAMEIDADGNEAKASSQKSLWFDFRRKELVEKVASESASAGLDPDRQRQLELRVASLREFWSIRGPGLAWLWAKQFPELASFDAKVFSVFPVQGGGGGWFSPAECWFEAVLHDADDRLPELVRLLFLLVGCGWSQWGSLTQRQPLTLVEPIDFATEFKSTSSLGPWPGFIEQVLILTLRLAYQVELVVPQSDILQLATRLWRLDVDPHFVYLRDPSAWLPYEKWLNVAIELDPYQFRRICPGDTQSMERATP